MSSLQKAAVLTLCVAFSAGAICHNPAPTPVAGDYGDAPDSMDAGYYGFTAAGPLSMVLSALGVQADFPTFGMEDPTGAFTVDVDDFWIGPLLAPPDPMHIPSVELDADDANDPDGLSNIQRPGPAMPWRADCDQENGFHVPAAGCPNPPLGAVVPNGILVLWIVGVPPQAFFITSVTAEAGVAGTAHWNMLFDFDQSGDWTAPAERPVADIPFALTPGGATLLVSPPFTWPTVGGGFGRIVFPVWARNMATEEMAGGGWEGEGPAAGYEKGEVEDYFIEWRLMGPRPDTVPPDTVDAEEAPAPSPEQLLSPECPAEAEAGTDFTCELPEGVAAVNVVCIPDPERGGASPGRAQLTPETPEGTACETETFEVGAALAQGALRVDAARAPSGSALLIYTEPGEGTGVGVGVTPIVGGVRVVIP